MYCTAHNLFNLFAIHNIFFFNIPYIYIYIYQISTYFSISLHPSVKIPFKNAKCLNFQEKNPHRTERISQRPNFSNSLEVKPTIKSVILPGIVDEIESLLKSLLKWWIVDYKSLGIVDEINRYFKINVTHFHVKYFF